MLKISALIDSVFGSQMQILFPEEGERRDKTKQQLLTYN